MCLGSRRRRPRKPATEIATARGFARARIIGGTRREQARLPKALDEGHLRAVLVPQPKNASPRLGGPPPSRGEVGQVRASWGAWGREVGLRTYVNLPALSCLQAPLLACTRRQ